MTEDEIARYIRTDEFAICLAVLEWRLESPPLPTIDEIAKILGLPIEAVLSVLPDVILDVLGLQRTDRVH